MSIDCEEAYGFFPCSTSIGGSSFLVVIYGAIFFRAAGWSTCRLKTLPHPLAGVLQPAIGALPVACMVLAATVTSSGDLENVAVGIGTLSGNVILMLLVAWGGAVLLGRCDLDANRRQISRVLRDPWDLSATGVSIDDELHWQASAMLASAAVYGIIQVPVLMGVRHLHGAYIAGVVVCFVLVLAYCSCQVFAPGIKKRRGEARRQRHLRYNAVRSISYYANRYGGILSAGGELNSSALARIFQRFDRDKDGLLDREEVSGMLTGMDFAARAEAGQLGQIAGYWMSELDSERTGSVTEERFCQVLQRWIAEKQRRFAMDFPAEPPKEVRRAGNAAWWLLVRKAPEDYCETTMAAATLATASGSTGGNAALTANLLEDQEREAYTVADMLETASEAPPSDSSSSMALQQQLATRSTPTNWAGDKEAGILASHQDCLVATVAVVLLSVAMCAVLARPLVEQLASLAEATGFSPSLVASVVAPVATSGAQVLCWLHHASARKSRNISLVVSQVYSSVVINNTLCFGCFLLGLCARSLPWHYTSEVALTVLPTLLLAGLALHFGQTIPARAGAAVLCCLPLILTAQWALKHRLGVQRG